MISDSGKILILRGNQSAFVGTWLLLIILLKLVGLNKERAVTDGVNNLVYESEQNLSFYRISLFTEALSFLTTIIYN